MKKIITLCILLSLTIGAPLAGAVTQTGSIMVLPTNVSQNVTRVVESTLSTNTGETAIAQDEVSLALGKLIQIYEKRVTRLQDEVNRLRIENEALKSKITLQTGITPSSETVAIKPSVPAVSSQKTELEKKHDIIVSNIVNSLPAILKKYNISATGSIGLFEFIEPKNFFISIDDGKNPSGITAFKTKILFEYDTNLNLKVIGTFDLDYATSRYVTLVGGNPFSGVARIRVKNPSYTGKLLEEVVVPTTNASIISSTPLSSTGALSTTNATGAGATLPKGTATLDSIRKAYEKNKLGDVVQMSTIYLQTNPNNVEVLTMRARSQYIFSKFDEALNDIHGIYKIQGQAIDCGIVNDGARAEKALKGARGNVFGGLQSTKCKR